MKIPSAEPAELKHRLTLSGDDVSVAGVPIQSRRRPRRMFCVGIGLGLLIGLGMLAGATLTASLNPFAALEIPLHATATHGGDSMAIATGLIDEGVAGVFILDFITGELTCQVLNPRTGTLAGLYKRTVSQDLGVEQGKQPKYLMVTGYLQVRQNIGNVKPADSLVYVADANTGRYVAYLLPWNKAAFGQNLTQASELIPIGRGSARNVEVEK
jgi:hypothetical protein